MGSESHQYALPAELDTYMQESIFHMLGFCASDQKLSKAKEEALLNAQALKRQVADSQKLVEQLRALKEECSRLENECALYHNDRDVFMEAAYEAEDGAAEAEDRAAEAERKNETLIVELEQIRKALAQDGRVTSEMDYTQDVASLKLRITELEEQNSRLQDEVWVLRAEGQQVMSAAFTESRSLPEEAALQALLLEAREKYEEVVRELRSLQDKYENFQVASKGDERAVHEMVSSVTAGPAIDICKAVEEEKQDSLNAINLEFSSIFRCMESELGSWERVKVAESDLQALRQEAALCRSNLDKAEVENKGGHPQSGGRPRSKTYEGHGEESICALCDARQPLMPLPGNSQERRLNR